MSVLSSPQGTPERVWSLVAGLAALGGECERSVLDALLNPGFMRDGHLVQAKDTLAANALGAASSLGLIDVSRERATLAPQGLTFADATQLADFVHDRLASLSSGETDAPILDAYAWMVAESDRQSSAGWIFSLGRDEFADAANSALVGQDDDGRLMNTTKVVAWRRWLTFLGLGTPIPNVADFPTPARRLVRELKRANTSNGATMPAEQFIALISSRMPYLDRGRLFIQACQRIGHASSQRRLSPLLSIALRDLHDEGTLRLNLSGDASVHVQLAQDSAHSVDAFTSVSIFPMDLQ